MKELKKYMATKIDRKAWTFYTLDSDGTAYLEIGGPDGYGWLVSKLKHYKLLNDERFLFCNDLGRLKNKTAKIDFEKAYGKRIKDRCDFCCPSCSYQFTARDYITDYDYNTFQDSYKQNINCICGTKFTANVKFIVKTEVSTSIVKK